MRSPIRFVLPLVPGSSALRRPSRAHGEQRAPRRRGRPLVAVIAALAPAVAIVPSAGAAPIEAIDPSPFVLRSGNVIGGTGLIDQLQSWRKLKSATVARVLRSANRKVRPLGDSAATKKVKGVEAGFRWNRGDDDTTDWYPQGISGSSDAVADSVWGKNRVLLTSWYSKKKGAANLGVRISFVKANDVGKAVYRHVLLVAPKPAGDYEPLRGLHAGGIAWYGRWLYVADTSGGLRVFDVQRMLEVSTAKKSIGCSTGTCYAGKYRFVLPQVEQYRPISGDLRFSYLSVNRNTKPDSLLAGEYVDGKPGGRLVRWKLDAGSGRLQASPTGLASAWTASKMEMTNVQGALSTGGRFLVSSSAGKTKPGRLASAVKGQPGRTYAWGVGAEDLTYWPHSDRLFTLTEHRKNRTVFAVRAGAKP